MGSAIEVDETARRGVIGGLAFGEGPRWHEGRLWLSDIGAGRVLRIAPDGSVETVARVPHRPSGLGWRPDGSLLVVSMEDHRLLRVDPDAALREARGGDAEEAHGLVEVADLTPWCGGPLNDMVVDAGGGAYVGNIGFDLEARPLEPRATHLVRVEPDGRARSVAEGLMAPNGMALTPDGATLVVGESGGACLTAFDVDPRTGDLSGRRVFAALEGGAVPDGICLDEEGAIWLASPTTAEFLRVREGGRVTHRIPTGERVAIACMLGGADRRTLFLITAPTASIRTASPLRDGRVDAVQVEVAGAGRP